MGINLRMSNLCFVNLPVFYEMGVHFLDENCKVPLYLTIEAIFSN